MNVEELVDQALCKLASSEGPIPLSGKGPTALFPSVSAGIKLAINRMQTEGEQLIDVLKVGKATQVTLTPVGLRQVLPKLSGEVAARAATVVVGKLSAIEKIPFLDEVIREQPEAALGLLPVLQNATAEEAAEREARIENARKRRETEEATRRALEEWQRSLESRRQQRVELLKREFEAEGAEIPVAPKPVEMKTELQPNPKADEPILRPETSEERSFCRDVAGRLVAAWIEAIRMKKDEGRFFLETALGNISGCRQIGEEGEQVRFDGTYHESDVGLSTGTTVRILRPGWALDEDDGEYILAPARVG